LFSQKEFIEASRKFVCVRLESYESKEHQDLVRSFLNGRFANTAFCILAPDGEERLSGASRGPANVLGAAGRGPQAEKGESAEVIEEMNQIARAFAPRGDKSQVTLQDFHTFRQALNVASGDQRLLLFVAAPESEQARIQAVLRPVFADEKIIGRFHLDLGSSATDASWSEAVRDVRDNSGFVVIRADQFGQEGEVMAQLPLSASGEELKAALLNSNQEFAKLEERKDYSEHVQLGRREGVFFENGMPYGEDRNGDGVIDQTGGGKGKGKGRKGDR